MRRRAALALMLSAATACSRSPGESPPAPPSPMRIVSLSPGVTEVLHGVGAFHRVVAVSKYCTYPPEVDRLPRAGSWYDLSLEQITLLRADLVILTETQASVSEEPLRRLGLPVLVVGSLSLDDALAAIATIGRATGNARQGDELARRTRAAIDEVRAKTRALAHPRVLCVVDRLPGTLRDLFAAAPGSFLFELVEVAGGIPVAPSTRAPYGELNKETVVALDPAIILDMVQGMEGKLAEDTGEVWRRYLPEVRAVRGGRIYPIRSTSVLHCSQFVADTARRFARLIHPEVFGDGKD